MERIREAADWKLTFVLYSPTSVHSTSKPLYAFLRWLMAFLKAYSGPAIDALWRGGPTVDENSGFDARSVTIECGYLQRIGFFWLRIVCRDIHLLMTSLPINGISVPAIRFGAWWYWEVFVIADLEWKIRPEFFGVFHLLTNVLDQLVHNYVKMQREKLENFANNVFVNPSPLTRLFIFVSVVVTLQIHLLLLLILSAAFVIAIVVVGCVRIVLVGEL